MEEAADAEPGSIMPVGALDHGLRVRIGRHNGEPVAVGMNHVSHGVVNLCLGATLPAGRRKGVWEALVWSRASDGPDLPAVAFTSDYSRPGFERMGFLVVTRFTLWVRAHASSST
jgi:hypothetical protein